MEGSTDTTTITTKTTFTLSSSSSSSPTSSPPPLLQPPSPPVILSPCAACKILRRRCVQKCVLAPYFPPNDPIKFTTAHRVFGASNIIKLLQDLPETQRADAVSSMVYEANARIRDPVYGCAGAIFQLQKQVNELEAQLARAQADLINMQTQHENLLAILCMAHSQQLSPPSNLDGTLAGAAPMSFSLNETCFLEDNGQVPMWEPLWA
ncbi:hypothetical protein Taro_035378 [Colocasia esculenta]|uniref:LOB domain-containing protein n=1 Tax=Colocasia esculenta TaxID=4460 RepID=A0A843VYV3_COLES|nr:hypothetical protein [Colocasia esculenta]